MSQLEAQKRLLIAESELNRARLATELAGLGSAVSAVADGATRVEQLFSTILTVVSGLVTRRSEAPAAAGKPSLITKVISAGSLLASLWQVMRRRS